MLRQVAFITIASWLVGVPASYLAANALRGVLVGVSPLDPSAVLVAGGVNTLAVVVAMSRPIRSVTHADPVAALHE
jgi:hypothetical protein